VILCNLWSITGPLNPLVWMPTLSGSSKDMMHQLLHSHHLPLMLVWVSRLLPTTCSPHPNWLITSRLKPFSEAKWSSAPCSVTTNSQPAQLRRSLLTACHHHHHHSPISSVSTRRRLSAKPRAAVGINLAKTTMLLALPDTLAHGIQNGLSTTNSPSCHHSHNPSVAVAHFPHVFNKRAVPPNMTSQPLQSPLSKLPQLPTTPLQLLSQSSPPQSTTPNTANGKRPLAPSHAVVVSSPNTVTASLAVIHSATNVNSNTTTHATNMLASMVFHWVHLAKSLVVNK